MKVISTQFEGYLKNSSMIRQMFEAGIRLRKEHGADAVCDFSIGNPDLPPPPEVAEALRELADHASEPFSFGYMPNAGFPWAREMLAAHLAKEQKAAISADGVMLSCGAAGAMNALFRAVLEPGDEVMCVAPYFVEYGFYAQNHGGVLKPVPAKKEDFSLDLAALEQAINARTRALIINSPNNPTGQIYSLAELTALADLLRRKNAEFGRPIFLAVDEPYRFLAFDGAEVPSLLPVYEYSVVLSSFAKNLSLPGERIGYLAVSDDMPERDTFMAAAIMANRILGYVNPPLVGQHLLKKALGREVDLNIYASRRNAMAKVLTDAGYEFTMPRGAFYFFPKAPGGDDQAFVDRLAKELVLAVPGRGFGLPGFFRLAFCVGEEVINKAAAGFKRARADF